MIKIFIILRKINNPHESLKAQKKSNADKLREVIKNEYGEYKEHVDEFINSLTAQKADSQKELEKERTMKQEADKETQRLRAKVADLEAKLAEAGATGASIAKLKANYETEFEGIETKKEEAQNATAKAKKQAKQYARKVEEAERKLAEFEQKESTINTQIGKTQADLKKARQ
ncbi:hypothetical protein EIN_040260 [Entamoeba invadens IP1]|uniref:Uncharacterized protein n=1 Tax=Entamoeba invadens IP1 TaxID=370355 RepID=A0A0A1TWD9_ENTIV|nr:hypothetical protein EIN_040260 [Entamoeba invadens IP1]ELP85482.1 hypothetical protein EIN_040260 [Entamoeba invadens IP1]|eukprot:XP_004184828.1 hypothetical protein EIN_040260 [Entamoeba invadens IP1]